MNKVLGEKVNVKKFQKKKILRGFIRGSKLFKEEKSCCFGE